MKNSVTKQLLIISSIILIALFVFILVIKAQDKIKTDMSAIKISENQNENSPIYLDTINPVFDAQGNAYPTIKIGAQVWMADNLRTNVCRDGSSVEKLEIGKFSDDRAMYWLDNDEKGSDANEYGPMYNWQAVQSCDICPKDYMIPSHADWRKLIRFWNGKDGIPAGHEGLAYSSYKLREPGQRLWPQKHKYVDTITAIGFDAKPGGWIENNVLQYYRERTSWWGLQNKLPYCVKIADGDGGMWTDHATLDQAMYVRCIKYK